MRAPQRHFGLLSVFCLLLTVAGVSRAQDDSDFVSEPTPNNDSIFGGGAAPKSGRDTIALTMLRDSLSLERLRDSVKVAGQLQTIRLDSIKDDRPGRAYLRTADPTLFLSHTGSVGQDYPLGPGDVLILYIWGQKQARYELEVDRDGQVEIPTVGVVSLNGATFGEARHIIGKRLGSLYSGLGSGLTNFDLTMEKLKQIRVFVMGDVYRPGGYLLSGNTSSLQALALAGGPTQKGSERLVKISRGDAEIDIDLYKYMFLGKRPAKDALQDGDIVRIPPALGTADVEGAVSRPGKYEVIPGSTVQDFIGFAGGCSPDCAMDQPVLLSHVNGDKRYAQVVGTTKEVLSGTRMAEVSAGDLVFAPRKPPTKRASPFVSGSVMAPGPYPYSSNLTVRDLVREAGGPASGAVLSRIVVFRFDSLGGCTVLRTSLESGPELDVFPLDSIVVGDRTLSPDTTSDVEVFGAVSSPGKYAWAKGMKLKDLLAMAGGISTWAEPREIRVQQADSASGAIRTRTIPVDTNLAGSAGDLQLQARALVTVPARRGRYMLPRVVIAGHVRQPQTLLLYSSREKVASAVAQAGGLSSAAYPEGAVLWRASEGRIPLNLSRALQHPRSDDNVFLHPGDSLYIPDRPATVRVSGRVNKPTQVLWRDGKDWKWYVYAAGGFADSANVQGVYVQYADGSIRSLDQGLDDPEPGSVVVVPTKDPGHALTAIDKISAFGTIASAVAALLTVYVIYLTTRK
jgi:protein involved in polysaccharide export with SLBB domain